MPGISWIILNIQRTGPLTILRWIIRCHRSTMGIRLLVGWSQRFRILVLGIDMDNIMETCWYKKKVENFLVLGSTMETWWCRKVEKDQTFTGKRWIALHLIPPGHMNSRMRVGWVSSKKSWGIIQNIDNMSKPLPSSLQVA